MDRTNGPNNEEAPNGIPVVFDYRQPGQEKLFGGFVSVFGDGYVKEETVDPPHRRCLTIFPGGARGISA